MGHLTIHYFTSYKERDAFFYKNRVDRAKFTNLPDFSVVTCAEINLNSLLKDNLSKDRIVYTGQEHLINAFRWCLVKPKYRELQPNVSFYRDGKLYQFDSNMKPVDGFWDYPCLVMKMAIDLL